MNHRIFSYLYLIIVLFTPTMCKKADDPEKENVPEVITKVTLTFTPETGEAVTVSATDPDKDGPEEIRTDGSIQLAANTTYTLTVALINTLYKAGEEGYSVTEEIEEEADEHQFFFTWPEDLFSDPSGSGNISREGTVNYRDQDKNGLSVGLETRWTTGDTNTNAGNKFRILLKHQPDVKSQTSSSQDGETDVDISFDISVQ